MSTLLVLKTALGGHAHVAALRDGRVCSPRIRFEFLDFDPLPGAFRRMVREGDLDVSEMAVVNHLVAVDHGRPLVALPIPLWSRMPHTNLICMADAGLNGPRDLEGGRVGVRAYTQTSGVWVRGLLHTEYGVDLEKITFVTLEDAHVGEYSDPPAVVRGPKGASLRQMLAGGALHAIMGERTIDPTGVRTVIPEAQTAAEAWVARTGVMPVNHVLAVRSELIDAHPWLGGELMALFEEARRIAVLDGAPAPGAYGLAANGRSLKQLIDYSFAQKLLSRAYGLEEIFIDPARSRPAPRGAASLAAAP